MKNNFIILAIIIIVSSIFILGGNFTPAVSVVGETLSFADFYKNRDGLARYRDLTNENVSDLDIEKSVILSFVNDALIKRELEWRRRGDKEVDKFIADRVPESDSGKIEEATKNLYGWRVADFRKFILYPQARFEMFSEELEKEKIDIDVWIPEAVSHAEAVIYLPRWRFEAGEVKSRY